MVECDRWTYKIYDRIGEFNREIDDLRYKNDTMQCRAKDNATGDRKFEHLIFIKEIVHFYLESKPIDFLFIELGNEDTVKSLRIISKSHNNIGHLRFQIEELKSENVKLDQ